ncbi:MAG: hypothetical protein IPM22_02605 [Betaproteobacteria bacterium]|nr:hypothetical protein [Betaproteobacteria bacterium]MCC7217816.1 hypothetical protein [Burkholderiales bacterium]
MPLLGFRPTKARLVMEDDKDSVLVMKVVLDGDDAVELATGGTLQDLAGVLRIRERRNHAANGHGPIGSLVYVAEAGAGSGDAPGKFQVNVAMAADKFGTLLRIANAGRLPTRFFVDTGDRKAGADAGALGYRMRSGTRVKVWDNHAHRTLPVTSFVMILPIDVPTAPAAGAHAAGVVAADPALPAPATNAQVAELMDDMLVFQSDTRHTMFGVLLVLGIVAVAALLVGIAVFFR